MQRVDGTRRMVGERAINFRNVQFIQMRRTDEINNHNNKILKKCITNGEQIQI